MKRGWTVRKVRVWVHNPIMFFSIGPLRVVVLGCFRAVLMVPGQCCANEPFPPSLTVSNIVQGAGILLVFLFFF